MFILGIIVVIAATGLWIGAWQTKQAMLRKANEILDASFAKDADIVGYYTANVNYYLAPYGKSYDSTASLLTFCNFLTLIDGLLMFYLEHSVLGCICIAIFLIRSFTSVTNFFTIPNDKTQNMNYLVQRYLGTSHRNTLTREEFLYLDNWSKEITHFYYSKHMSELLKRDV